MYALKMDDTNFIMVKDSENMHDMIKVVCIKPQDTVEMQCREHELKMDGANVIDYGNVMVEHNYAKQSQATIEKQCVEYDLKMYDTKIKDSENELNVVCIEPQDTKCMEHELMMDDTQVEDCENMTRVICIEPQDTVEKEYTKPANFEFKLENDSIPHFEDTAHQKVETQCAKYEIEMDDRKDNMHDFIKVECIQFEDDNEMKNTGSIKSEFEVKNDSIPDFEDYGNAGDMNEQDKVVEQNAGLPYMCTVCRKRFRTWRQRVKHTIAHSAEGLHLCNICGRSFTQQENLTTHTSIHCVENPFTCDFCEKRFTQRVVLTKHMKTHSTDLERPYTCNICEKGFTEQSDFAEHMRIHSVRKPYSCNICGKGFKQ